MKRESELGRAKVIEIPIDGNTSGAVGNASRAGEQHSPKISEVRALLHAVEQNQTTSEGFLSAMEARGWTSAISALPLLDNRSNKTGKSDPSISNLIGVLANEMRETFAEARRQQVKLVRLSLTRRDPEVVEACAPAFVQVIAGTRHEGALLALDIAEGGRGHLYGLAMVADPEAALDRWCEFPDASPTGSKWRVVSGWSEFEKSGNDQLLLHNVSKVLQYTLKSWPEVGRRRDIRHHTYTSGSCCAPWSRTLALTLGNSGESSSCRRCENCGSLLGRKVRAHKRSCSATCRAAASKRRRRRADAREWFDPKASPSTKATIALHRQLQGRQWRLNDAVHLLLDLDLMVPLDELEGLLNELVDDGLVERHPNGTYSWL